MLIMCTVGARLSEISIVNEEFITADIRMCRQLWGHNSVRTEHSHTRL